MRVSAIPLDVSVTYSCPVYPRFFAVHNAYCSFTNIDSKHHVVADVVAERALAF